MENVLSIHGFTGDENWIKEMNELIDMTLENLIEIYGKARLIVFFLTHFFIKQGKLHRKTKNLNN